MSHRACATVRRTSSTQKLFVFLEKLKNFSINFKNIVLKPFPDFSLPNSKDFSSIS